MVKKITFALVAITTFILLNIFSRFLYSQSWFSTTTFSKELNPFEIITLVVTTLVTIWLGWFVSKKLTEQRYQKEYIINDLKIIEEEINFIEKSIQYSTVDLQTLLGLLNKLKTYLERFSKTIEIFEIKSVDALNLNEIYIKLYEKTTDIESNQLSLNDTNRNEIYKICNDFIITTRKMIFTINCQ